VSHRTEPITSHAPLTRPPLDELRGPYRVRFARTRREIEGCFRLRFEVFNVELGEGLASSDATGLDTDRFDAICDHVVVTEEATGQVVGTYRMQTWETARDGQGFYSAAEFDLSGIPETDQQQAIELGRAAVAKDHRDQMVLFLLWRGLAAYFRWNAKRYFFGCSSLTSQDPEEGLRAYDWLERRGHLHPTYDVRPRPEFACVAEGHEPFEGEYPIPKLFGAYLRHGARVCGPPAIDREFGTIDFLTWTDTELVAAKPMKLYSRGLPRRA